MRRYKHIHLKAVEYFDKAVTNSRQRKIKDPSSALGVVKKLSSLGYASLRCPHTSTCVLTYDLVQPNTLHDCTHPCAYTNNSANRSQNRLFIGISRAVWIMHSFLIRHETRRWAPHKAVRETFFFIFLDKTVDVDAIRVIFQMAMLQGNLFLNFHLLFFRIWDACVVLSVWNEFNWNWI